MSRRAAFRNAGFWWGLAALVAVSVVIDALGADASPSADSNFVPRPDAGDSVPVAQAVAPSPADRKIAPLALVDPPAGFEFFFADSIDAAAQAEVRGEAGLAARYFEATGNGGLNSLTIVVDDDAEALSERYAGWTHSTSGPGDPAFWDHHSGVYSAGRIFLLLGGSSASSEDDYYDDYLDDYPTSRGGIRERTQVTVIHELTHALDAALAGQQNSHDVPDWLVEGSAEVEAYTALDAFGFRTYASECKSRVSEARQVLTTLAASGDADGRDVYTLGFLAVDRLTAPGDLAPLREFWVRLRTGNGWASAFEQSFKVTPDAFLASFEAYREANFPRYRGEIRGHVEGADRATVVRVWACGDDSSCFFGETDPDGNFLLAVPDDQFTIEFELQPDDTAATLTRIARSFYYVLGGVTTDSDDAAMIQVHGNTVTGVDLPLSALQQRQARP